MRAFRDGSPYANEDLFSAGAPALNARCTRDGMTPGMCLSERRIDGADLTFRFPQKLAGAMARRRERDGAFDGADARAEGLAPLTPPQPRSTRSSSRIAIWNWNERSSSSSSTNSTPMNSSPI